MFRQLLITDLDANKNIILVVIMANLFLFALFAYRGSESVQAFAAASTLIFLVFLTVNAAGGSNQKRCRLYAQLPITATEAFLSGWFIFFSWLGIHVLLWMLYGLVVDPEFSLPDAPGVAASAISVIFIVMAIALAIDLGAFKPAYLQWIYISILVLIIVLIDNVESFREFLVDENGNIPILSITFSEEIGFGTVVSIFLCAGLLFADYLVWVKSDHYIR